MTDFIPANKIEIHEGRATTRARMLRTGAILSAPGLLWLLVFLFLPMIGLCIMAFATRGDYGAIDWTFSLENFRRLMGFGLFGWTPDTFIILSRSAGLAVITTVLCILFSLPLAFWIASRKKSQRNLLMALIMVPSCTNLVIRTYAWMLVLNSEMPPAEMAQWLGLLGGSEGLYPGFGAVFIGMVSSMLPFAALPIYTAVERLDWSLVEAARDLYASSISTFRHAILPQLMSGLVAAVILTLVPSLGMFIVSDMLGGARHMLIGNLIQQQFGSASDWPYGAMAGLFLIITSLLSLAAFQKWGGNLLPRANAPRSRS